MPLPPIWMPYMAQTRDWISEIVNCPGYAVEAHKRPLTVCVIRGCRGCMHDGALSGCYILLMLGLHIMITEIGRHQHQRPPAQGVLIGCSDQRAWLVNP